LVANKLTRVTTVRGHKTLPPPYPTPFATSQQTIFDSDRLWRWTPKSI